MAPVSVAPINAESSKEDVNGYRAMLLFMESLRPECFRAQATLASLGFPITQSGPHTGRTLVLSELTSLLKERRVGSTHSLQP